KKPMYYNLEDDEIVPVSGLMKKTAKNTTASIVSKSNKTIPLAQFNFFETSCIPEDKLPLFEECYTSDLNDLFGSLLTKYTKNSLSNTIYWKYDDKYLLPNRISLAKFKDDSSICIPLESMFHLAGYHDIKGKIDEALTQRPTRLTNILKKVSEKSTEYLHSVWKDYKNIEFNLTSNGPNIDIHIKDKENLYDCDQRSDGFKRFVTFLLALSARVNNGKIKNSIIVVDEPDLGIHILGQKNLVQELIKISKNNFVFYSTHSIFMIDKENITRHFVVSKKNEITTIKRVTNSDYADDEVILNALGYSLFETLKPRNIIFEGWTDKHVFEVAIKSKKASKNHIDQLKNIGAVHSAGVKGIVNIAKILELANREYFVISDSDKPAKEMQNKYKEEKCLGEWFAYDHFISNIHTLEDFIKHSSYKKSIDRAQKEYNLTSFDQTSFETHPYRRVPFIFEWINSSVKNTETSKNILKEIKTDLYSAIKASDIEDLYFEFLASINNYIGESGNNGGDSEY
ncbi:ATP-binding protein, partial [Synergistaceae bacterium OttesenSCG-928-I11]|nr:ATP-binding protein [Synergistaceae bacterium OttesenSCG-928-I11]